MYLFAFYFIFILHVLFLFNSALTIIGLLLYFKIFLIKTTILERGRVWAYFFVLIFAQVVLFVGLLIFVFLAVIPLIIIFSAVYLFRKNIKKNTICQKIYRKIIFESVRCVIILKVLT